MTHLSAVSMQINRVDELEARPHPDVANLLSVRVDDRHSLSLAADTPQLLAETLRGWANDMDGGSRVAEDVRTELSELRLRYKLLKREYDRCSLELQAIDAFATSDEPHVRTIAELTHDLAGVTDERDQLQRDLDAHLSGEVASNLFQNAQRFAEERDALRRELQDLRIERDALRGKLESCARDRDGLLNDYNAHLSHEHDLGRALDDTRRDLTAVAEDRDRLLIANRDLEAKVYGYQTRLRDCESGRTGLRRDLDRAEAELRTLTDERDHALRRRDEPLDLVAGESSEAVQG